MFDRVVRGRTGILAVMMAMAATTACGVDQSATRSARPADAGGRAGGTEGSSVQVVQAAAPAAPTLLTSGASSQNSTVYSLGTASFVAGRVYLAFVSVSDGGGDTDPTPGVEGAGTSWTRVDTGEATRAAFGLTAYSFVPSEDLVDVPLSTGTLGTLHEGIWYAVVEIGGDVDLDAPVVQYRAGRAGPGTGYALSLPDPPAVDSTVVAAFAHAADEESTPGPGWNELVGTDLSLRAPVRGAHVIFDETAPVNPASSSWASSKPRRGVVVELRSGSAAAPPGGVTLVAAGDMCGGCGRTSMRALERDPDVIVTAGDLAYSSGLLSEFEQKYG